MKKIFLILSFFLFFSGIYQIALGKETGYQSKKFLSNWGFYPTVYQTFINYKNSPYKSWGLVTTGYLSVWKGYYNNFQGAISYTYIEQKQDKAIKQLDYTILYSNVYQLVKKWSFTGGFHYIDSTDALSDGAITILGDITRSFFQKKYPYAFRWSIGGSLYVSYYPNNPRFTVLQLTPHFTTKLFYNAKFGALYLDLLEYSIFLSKSEELGLNKKGYYSVEGDLRYYKGKIYLKIGGWIGEQIFAVKNGGFVVYNLTEKYENGALVEAGYFINKKYYLSINYSWNPYYEENKKAYQDILTLAFSFKF